MKRLFLIGFAVACLIAAAASAQARGLLRRHHCHEECCEPCPPPLVEKCITCYRPEWRVREVPCTVNRMVSRQVVENRSCTVNVPVWTEQKRFVTEYVRKPRVIEKEVVVCCRVPVAPPLPPPCSDCGDCDECCRRHQHRLLHRVHDCCCPRPCYQTVQQVKKVPCTVMECCPVQREICCKVCTYRSEVRNYQVCRTVCECHPETVVRKERYCVMVPYQKVIKVPACCCN